MHPTGEDIFHVMVYMKHVCKECSYPDICDICQLPTGKNVLKVISWWAEFLPNFNIFKFGGRPDDIQWAAKASKWAD